MRPDDEFPEIDTKTASAARTYDYSRGGTDNYAVDRQAIGAVEVGDFFAGLEIVDPGLVNVYDWSSDGPAEVQTAAGTEFGGVGPKPAGLS